MLHSADTSDIIQHITNHCTINMILRLLFQDKKLRNVALIHKTGNAPGQNVSTLHTINLF